MRSLGVATGADLADYYRQGLTTVRPLIAELVDEGALEPVQVEGWRERAYVDPAAPAAGSWRGRCCRRSILSSSPAAHRAPVRFHYRIEIYTPAPKRIYGYYVLPFLLGEDLVARVDLKADRARSTLLVPGAFTEPGVVPEAVADEPRRRTGVDGWLARPRGSRSATAASLAAPLKKLV